MITRRNLLIGTAALAVAPGAARAAIGVNLVYDTVIRSTPSVPKPGYLRSFIDPFYRTRITRISGDPGTAIPRVGGTWSPVVKHHYSKDQAWNADQSLLYILNSDGTTYTKGGLFLDGNTYAPLFGGATKPSSSTAIWHRTNPNLMVYAAGSVLGVWNVRTGLKTTIKSFSGYSTLGIGRNEGNLSLNGTRIVLNATRGSDSHVVCFAYDIPTRTKFPDIDITTLYSGKLDNCSISPKGGYVLVQNSSDYTTIFTVQGVKVADFRTYGTPSHSDMAVDTNGEEVAVGVDKGSTGKHGLVIKRRLKDGAITRLTTAGYASHTSCRDTAALQQWAFCSYEASSYPLYLSEIVAPLLDGSKVYRLCHHHNVEVDYDSETHGSASPTGDRVIFVSNWGVPGGRPVQTYVCDLR
jgi:hypothetical protein